jgi:hypothetical protein
MSTAHVNDATFETTMRPRLFRQRLKTLNHIAVKSPVARKPAMKSVTKISSAFPVVMSRNSVGFGYQNRPSRFMVEVTALYSLD